MTDRENQIGILPTPESPKLSKRATPQYYSVRGEKEGILGPIWRRIHVLTGGFIGGTRLYVIDERITSEHITGVMPSKLDPVKPVYLRRHVGNYPSPIQAIESARKDFSSTGK